MQLPTRSFAQFLEDMSAVLQGAATNLIDLSVGSVVRAILEANASIALWIQWLILRVLQTTRAATCTGSDLDSWMQDFSVTRLPATPATGSVMFSRFANSVQAVVPTGALVKTTDGSQTFSVTIDTTNTYWSASVNGYVLPIAVSSITVPVTALVAGSLGNVQARVISVIASAIPSVDTVTNAAPFSDGSNAETDSAFRVRFQNFLASRSRATLGAIGFAIECLQQGLTYLVQENVDTSGALRQGSFVVTVDDGSGAPPESLLEAVASAVDAVRPVGSVFAVQPPVIVLANVLLSVALLQGNLTATTISAIVRPITQYIDRLPIGASLSITRIAQIAYRASTLVGNVSAITINGVATDFVPAANGVIKTGTILVT